MTDRAPEGAKDRFALEVEARSRQRRLGDLPRLLGDALRLVWSSAGRRFVVTAVFQLFSAALLALQLFIGKAAIDAVLHASRTNEGIDRATFLPLVLLAVVTAASSMLSNVATQYQRLLVESVTQGTWNRLLDVTSSVDLQTFEEPAFYDHLHRVEIGAIQRPVAVIQALIALVSGVAGVVALSAAIVRISFWLLPLLLLAGPLLLALSRRGGTLEFAFVRDQTPGFRERLYLRTLMTDREEAKEIRAFDLVGTLRHRYDERYDGYLLALRQLVSRRVRLALVSAMVSTVILCATFVLLLLLVVHDQLTLSEAAVAAVAIRLLSSRMESFFRGLGQLYESGLFLSDLKLFLDRMPVSRDETPSSPAPRMQSIELADVSFTYPASAGAAVEHISMTIRAGEVVALVGANGSGKTTLAKLIGQLYAPHQGTVSWNGVPVAGGPQPELRRRIAVIFQDFARFRLPAHDNVAFGDIAGIGDNQRVRAAARKADVDEALSGLPAGYDTVLSTQYAGGSDLSVGQWQRVALARALFREADLVILDEPSSALDARTERELFTSIRDLTGDRAVLMISHRFSSVRSADRIVVLDGGHIVETGSHDELVELGGLYADLFRMQAASYQP
ncbi:MAG: ATP-binding cassette, subfamily bacterial [Actinomycetota bacterium]|nr:ATP-binding cassette, subfamily bacterial [Actinomycetota bacterium]